MRYGYRIKAERKNNSAKSLTKEYGSHRRVRIMYSDKKDNREIKTNPIDSMDIIKDEVYRRLLWNSESNRMGWGGHCGIVDGRATLDKVEWLRGELETLTPKRILEIGTNYGSFSWLLYTTLAEFRLETCDIVESSREEIEWINRHYGKDWVKFYNVSSEAFLEGRFGADLVWMDGNHQTEWVKKEILWIEATQAPIVWIDDWNWAELREGVEGSGTRYKLERTSPNGDVAIMRLDGVSQ